MQELKKHIENADAILARLSVSGDAVMMMAAVRSELKEALACIPCGTQKKGDGKDG